jgi:hypothetical protein
VTAIASIPQISSLICITPAANPEFRDRRYASVYTDPSATADIEGVLIHGPKVCAHCG